MKNVVYNIVLPHLIETAPQTALFYILTVWHSDVNIIPNSAELIRENADMCDNELVPLVRYIRAEELRYEMRGSNIISSRGERFICSINRHIIFTLTKQKRWSTIYKLFPQVEDISTKQKRWPTIYKPFPRVKNISIITFMADSSMHTRLIELYMGKPLPLWFTRESYLMASLSEQTPAVVDIFNLSEYETLAVFFSATAMGNLELAAHLYKRLEPDQTYKFSIEILMGMIPDIQMFRDIFDYSDDFKLYGTNLVEALPKLDPSFDFDMLFPSNRVIDSYETELVLSVEEMVNTNKTVYWPKHLIGIFGSDIEAIILPVIENIEEYWHQSSTT